MSGFKDEVSVEQSRHLDGDGVLKALKAAGLVPDHWDAKNVTFKGGNRPRSLAVVHAFKHYGDQSMPLGVVETKAEPKRKKT